jgi:4-hydroxybenzoate polyprenyltransferase
MNQKVSGPTPKTQHPSPNLLLDLYRLFRFSAFGATAVLPLLGAAAGGGRAGWAEVGGLLLVAACFHGFAYITNDLVDLAVDRRQPLRRDYPLVRGALRPWQALIIVLALGMGAFLFHHRGAEETEKTLIIMLLHSPAMNGQAMLREAEFIHTIKKLCAHWASVVNNQNLLLGAAFGLMTAYNLWGKRCPLPPLTDLAQGLGWAALLLWGALASGGALTPLVWALAAHEVALIMLVNGLHGGLRDLASDEAGGARTTALWLGARPTPGGGAQISRRLLAYGLLWQGLALAALLLPLALNWPGYGPATWALTAAALLGLGWAVGWAAGQARATGEQSGMIALGMIHLTAALSAPIALAAGLMGGPLLLATLLTHTVPLLSNGMTYDALRWVRGRR